jgi:hypothetical protein
MNSLDFAITVNLSMGIEKGQIALSIKKVDLNPAMLGIPTQSLSEELEQIITKKTYHEIISEAAKQFINETGKDQFSAADLYNRAKLIHPWIKRSTFNNRVMAAALNHPSNKHLTGTKDFFEYLGDGKYRLKDNHEQPMVKPSSRPSDEVRQYAKEQYIDQARNKGKDSVSIRAGNIHKELGFSQRLPLVCGALRSNKFQQLCDIELIKTEGPNNSTTTTFTYKILRR